MLTNRTFGTAAFPALVFLAFASACISMNAQSPVLAKVAIGMSEEQVIAAIGPAYHLKRKTYANLPSMTSLMAESDPTHLRHDQSGYEFTFVDGKLEAFSSNAMFPGGSQPLANNIYRSVADKLGDASDGRPDAGNGYWILDTQGHEVKDNRLHTDCYASGSQGLPPVALHDPRCGLWVRLASVASQERLVSSTILMVINEAAFNKLAEQLRQAAQQKTAQQQKQANQVKTPF